MENKNIRYILDNIIKKAKYNEDTKEYEIKEEDYFHLNLTSKQKRLLKIICDNLGIKLEYISYTKELLPAVEDEKLFEEYNQILDKLTVSEGQEKETLEKRKIEIRNKIWNDNVAFVKALIERRINKLEQVKDFDDIVQTAYEILLEYIDKNHLYKGVFKNHISNMLLLYTSRRILNDTEGVATRTKSQLDEVNRAKEIKDTIDLEELSKVVGLPRKRIEELLILDNIKYPISIEEQITLINSKEFNEDSILYDDTFEKTVINKERKEIILKIIKTLPKIEQEMLILYFGLNGRSYKMDEIGKMYNSTKSYSSYIINKALDTIKSSIRINYLKEVYDTTNHNEEEKQTSNKLLEDFLIRNLPYNTTEYIKQYLEKDTLNFFEIYITNHDYKLKEMSEALNISITKAHKLKIKTISSVRYIILEKLNNKRKEKITYEEYLNYLMQLWLHSGYSKRKVR